MLDQIRSAVATGARISTAQAAWLFEHAPDAELIELAQQVRGRFHAPEHCSYLVMAIINTTNVCVAKCDYCSFYRWPGEPDTYTLTTEQITERIDQLVTLGGTLVGFNGGFHPDISVDDYCRLFSTLRTRYDGKAGHPQVHFYEMTVAEFMFVSKRSGLSYAESAAKFAASGTGWITGGGAEILEDRFRMRHSPGKYKVEDYFDAQRAILDAGIGSTATMVIGFDETLDERMSHLERLRRFQDDEDGRLTSFLCWTYKPFNNDLGGAEITTVEYLRWLAICRIYLDNIVHIRTSVLTQNEDAMQGLVYGADDFDLPTEDEVTTKAGATISHDFEHILQAARAIGYRPLHRKPWKAGPGRPSEPAQLG